MQKNDIVIGTKEEAKWTDIKKLAEERISNSKIGIVIDDNLIKLCDEKILEEQNAP